MKTLAEETDADTSEMEASDTMECVCGGKALSLIDTVAWPLASEQGSTTCAGKQLKDLSQVSYCKLRRGACENALVLVVQIGPVESRLELAWPPAIKGNVMRLTSRTTEPAPHLISSSEAGVSGSANTRLHKKMKVDTDTPSRVIQFDVMKPTVARNVLDGVGGDYIVLWNTLNVADARRITFKVPCKVGQDVAFLGTRVHMNAETGEHLLYYPNDDGTLSLRLSQCDLVSRVELSVAQVPGVNPVWADVSDDIKPDETVTVRMRKVEDDVVEPYVLEVHFKLVLYEIRTVTSAYKAQETESGLSITTFSAEGSQITK